MQRIIIFILLTLLVITSIFGCIPMAQLQPQVQGETYAPISVPNNEKTKQIALQRVRIEIPQEKVIGEITDGLIHTKMSDIKWNIGTIDSSGGGLSNTFYNELNRMGYNVDTPQHDLFEKKTLNSELIAGALIKDIRYDIHIQPEMFNKYTGSATATLTVEWQVYSATEKKVVYTHQVTGYAHVPLSGMGPQDILNGAGKSGAFTLAFTDAVRGLMADPAFHQLVSGGADRSAQ